MLKIKESDYTQMYGKVERSVGGGRLCSCACNCSCHCNCRKFTPDSDIQW